MDTADEFASLQLDALIFDMDGVLVDVTRSYRRTIQETVAVYLETVLGFRRDVREIVTAEEIAFFKSAGGFNNDWDLTTGMLSYLLSLSGLPALPRRKSFSTADDTVSFLRKEAGGTAATMAELDRGKRIPAFMGKVKSRGGGLKGIRDVLGASREGWIYHTGDLGSANLVQRIFQECYLGDRFEKTHNLKPCFHAGHGLYREETLIIPRKVLAWLRKRLSLAIATGRPRLEAELALDRLRIKSYFSSVVTLDECTAEEERFRRERGRRIPCSKPSPYSLLRAIAELGLDTPRCGYVGDTVDDMRAGAAAAKQADVTPIGFVADPGGGKERKNDLFRAGADHVIEAPEELLCLIR
jgi:HAD superfamily phosphatase